MMEQTDRQSHTVIVDGDEALRNLSSKSYVSCTEMEPVDDLYEVTSRKRHVKYNRPVQSAFSTLALSKLHMLSFVNWLNECLDRTKYCCCFSDTDSIYLSLAHETIEECVKPEKMEYYMSSRDKWFATNEFTKREPGNFLKKACQPTF